MAFRTVDLTWEAPASGGQLDGYHIYRKEGEAEYASIGDATALTFSDTQAEEGKTYTYKVTAFGPGGESAGSNEAVTPIPFQVPGAPVNLVATVI